MEIPQPINESPVTRNRTPFIIAGVAIVLCCFCVVVAVASFYGYFTVRSVDTQILPEENFPPFVTEEIVTPSFGPGPGEPPTGGLGNDILRRDTWQAVAAAAVGQGCDQPLAEDSTIEVLQEPDANGVWLEKWTVACSSGDTYAFEVEYILDNTGATFNIKSLP